jgi:hypothetical protein
VVAASLKGKPPDGGKKKKKARKRARKGKGGWWKSLEESIVDPISLEPIRDLSYPPFEVVSEHAKKDGGPGSGRVTHYFDGQFLAHYVVSTANFINPVNRDQLDRSVCLRLDAYLGEHDLPSARVAECFRLFEVSSAKQVGDESAHARQLRQEATAVMAALFRTRSDSTQGMGDEDEARDEGAGGAAGGKRSKNRNKKKKLQANGGRGPAVQNSNYSYERRTQGRGGGLVMVDEDDWEAPEAFNLTEEQDFPTFAGAEADAAAAAAAAPQHLHPSERKAAAKKAKHKAGKGGSASSSSEDAAAAADSAPQWRAIAGAGSLPYMDSSAEFPSLAPGKRKISRLPGKASSSSSSSSTGRWSNLHGDAKLGAALGGAGGPGGPGGSGGPGVLGSTSGSASTGVMRMNSLASRLASKASEPAAEPARRPARLALRLKKRSAGASAASAPSAPSGNPLPLEERQAAADEAKPTSYSSIFGEARPTETSNSSVSAATTTGSGGGDMFSSSLHAARFAAEISKRPICPYSPWLLGFGRYYGSRWILSVERFLQEGLERRSSGGGNTVSRVEATCSLPPMPHGQRKFVHEYCQKHWGLRTFGVDPEPNRFVQVHYKLSHPVVPPMLLSRAISVYHDLAIPLDMLDTVRDPVRNKSYNGCVGLWDMSAPGGLRVAKSQVGALLGQTSARRSEYHLAWVDPHNLLVQFESASVARKAFRQLDAMQGRAGAIAWRNPIQWFPEPPEWAAQQLQLRVTAAKDAERLSKQEKQHRAQREQERADALKFREDAQRHSGRDAWGDDDNDSGGGAVPAAAAAADGGGGGGGGDNDSIQRQRALLAKESKMRFERRKARAVDKPRRTEVKSIVSLAKEADQNMWATLSSSESEDDKPTEGDYMRAGSSAAAPMLSADNRIAGAVSASTVCMLCDTDLAAAAGLDSATASIDDCIEAGQDVPRCRQCKTVVCRQCASRWEKSTCPFCRCNNYLNEYTFQQRQLKEAGFKDSVSNIAALQSTAGNVNAAIALLLRED